MVQPPSPVSSQPQTPQLSSHQPQHSRRHSTYIRACCSVCGKTYSPSHQRHHPLAPSEFPKAGTCAKCRKESSPISDGSDGGGPARGRHIPSDDHTVQVVRQGDQIQIRIFSDTELNIRKPGGVQHPKPVKRTGSVPARLRDTELPIPTRGFGQSTKHTTGRRSPSRRRNPSRQSGFSEKEMRDPYARGASSSLPGAHSHHMGYPQQSRLGSGDRSPNQDLVLPVKHIEALRPQRETHESYQAQRHDSHSSRSHRRYQSVDNPVASLQSIDSPTYNVQPIRLPGLREVPNRFRWQRRGNCGSIEAVVGSPHVHFKSDASQQETNIFHRSSPLRRRRLSMTDELKSILGPDSDGGGKVEDSMHGMLVSLRR
jgi:hypothetical protein